MRKSERQSLIAIPVILAVGVAIAWAGSDGTTTAFGWPVFAICGAGAFALNWLLFIPAYAFRTERFFDVAGSATYLTLVVSALAMRGDFEARAYLLGGLIILWCVRLGAFLFIRISQDGSDGRFDRIKLSLPRFFMTWSLQALWVFLTAACGLAAMTSYESRALGVPALIGTLIWAAGFAIEVAADQQKRQFRADASNEGRFITSGLWAWSRHPNYFGEIALWVGIALIAFPVLSGWQYATLISPVFVYVLLTRISGIPMLEVRAKGKWGEDPEFQAYHARTSILVPRPPRGV
jgi:steroid 5-alpha reductase family enzyme